MTRREIAIAFLGAVAIACIALSWPVRADQACSFVIDGQGKLSGQCSSATSAPNPTPIPVPAPIPPVPPSQGCTPQGTPMSMVVGGKNNYITTNTTKLAYYPIPDRWADGTELLGAGVQFAPTPGTETVSYEVAFSPCPGDFTYYKTSTSPCGSIDGATMAVYWVREGGPNPYSCYIPKGQQWYMNWRPVNCKGYCGQTFYVPRG